MEGNSPCEHWGELEMIERIRKLPKWLLGFSLMITLYIIILGETRGEDNFSVMTKPNVEWLARNKVDEQRETGFPQIAKAHHSALSEVIDI